jgi:signal transduction histidine kinase
MLLTAFGGAGIAVYALGWALLPAVHTKPQEERRAWSDRDNFTREVIGAILLTVAFLLTLRQLGVWFGDELVWPLLLSCAGVALIWRQADGVSAWTPAELRHPLRGVRDRMRGDHGADGRRTALGVALVLLAAYLLLSATGALRELGNAIGGVVVVLGAVALVFGPWLARLGRSLAEERGERIRSQERAEVAAHLHDSVLQTLALIQKRAEDPREVASLARQQERELRHWLSGRPAKPAGESLAAALEETAAEVERLHSVPIEVVVVGDHALDERLGALVQAAREAMSNAAKFAGSAKVDLYAEVEPGRAEVFVRDRGVGFDLATIPADRRGVRESIVGRMERHGGRAVVHAAPGVGTEVELTMSLPIDQSAAPEEPAAPTAPDAQVARDAPSAPGEPTAPEEAR